MPAEANHATLNGRITITPPLDHEEIQRLGCSGYVKVLVSNVPGNSMGFVKRGVAIVPGPLELLFTGGVARDVKDLIAEFPGHRFEGSLVRTGVAKFGSARSYIEVLADGSVRY